MGALNESDYPRRHRTAEGHSLKKISVEKEVFCEGSISAFGISKGCPTGI